MFTIKKNLLAEEREGQEEEQGALLQDGTNLGKLIITCKSTTIVTHSYIQIGTRRLSPVDVQAFVQETGPLVPISTDPLELFSLFFTPDIVSNIVSETNR